MSPARATGQLWARWVLDPVLGAREGLLAEWREGKFTRIESAPRPPADLPESQILADHLLTPGLLNAHSHLDYSFLRGRLPRGVGFAPWLRAMIEARRGLSDGEIHQADEVCATAMSEAVAEGTTEIWDVSTYGWAIGHFDRTGLSGISFREWIAPRQAEWTPQWLACLAELRALRRVGPHRVHSGFSPHSTYTVVGDALATSADWARRLGLPLAIHLAESPEERELLVNGAGPLTELLHEVGGYDPVAELGTGVSAIRRAAEAGVLGPDCLVIHANLPEPDDIATLSDSGAVVAFCPRSHAFFGYPPYPLAAWRQAGVRLALGTDSLASNDSLSVRAEITALAALAPGLSPLELLTLATGAALGEAPPFGPRGRLEVGFPAQWAAWQIDNPSASISPDSLWSAWLADATRCDASSAWFSNPI